MVVSRIFDFHPENEGRFPIWGVFFKWVVQPPTKVVIVSLRSHPLLKLRMYSHTFPYVANIEVFPFPWDKEVAIYAIAENQKTGTCKGFGGDFGVCLSWWYLGGGAKILNWIFMELKLLGNDRLSRKWHPKKGQFRYVEDKGSYVEANIGNEAEWTLWKRRCFWKKCHEVHNFLEILLFNVWPLDYPESGLFLCQKYKGRNLFLS